jgi:RimJ/RimL family protein N-acetyltransferase
MAPGRLLFVLGRRSPPTVFAAPFTTVVTFDSLPVLRPAAGGFRLREVDVCDAAALTALFQLPEVAAHLDPPPATPEDFGAWIALSQSRRADGKAACYALLTGKDEVSGLFMALRFEDPNRAEIGFALAPRLWGTGIFMQALEIYLEFLFTEWGIKTLVGKTSTQNQRGVGVMRKLGATVIERVERNGVPEFVWIIERS